MTAKIATLLLWAACLGGFVVEYPVPFNDIAYWTTIGLAGAHVIECAVFAQRAIKAEGSTALHMFQIFVFGYFHANTLPE